MKRILCTALLGLSAWSAGAASWLTDFPAAQAQAQASNKLILMDFTGSDWCPWCIKFRHDVLDTPAFQAYADKNVVLLEVDFPDKKSQSSDLKHANAVLKDRYHIEGFPTLIILDSSGKEVGRQVGYSGGGPTAFIATLDKYKAGK